MATEESRRKNVFNANFEQLMEYVRADKLSKFPGECREARRLSNWMHRQFKRTTNIPDDEQAKLDELRRHFDDTPREVKEDKRWRHNLCLLKSYKDDYHTFVISKKDESHKRLYNWAANQRKAAKKNKLPQERLLQLKEIGYIA